MNGEYCLKSLSSFLTLKKNKPKPNGGGNYVLGLNFNLRLHCIFFFPALTLEVGFYPEVLMPGGSETQSLFNNRSKAESWI